MTTSAEAVDWEVAGRVAQSLGARTQALVADRDAGAVRDWALTMAGECAAENIARGNWPRAASYLELAVLVGAPAPVSAQAELEVVADA
jgi:hypothetical protein